jgi:hypothetical protein
MVNVDGPSCLLIAEAWLVERGHSSTVMVSA